MAHVYSVRERPWVGYYHPTDLCGRNAYGVYMCSIVPQNCMVTSIYIIGLYHSTYIEMCACANISCCLAQNVLWKCCTCSNDGIERMSCVVERGAGYGCRQSSLCVLLFTLYLYTFCSHGRHSAPNATWH